MDRERNKAGKTDSISRFVCSGIARRRRTSSSRRGDNANGERKSEQKTNINLTCFDSFRKGRQKKIYRCRVGKNKHSPALTYSDTFEKSSSFLPSILFFFSTFISSFRASLSRIQLRKRKQDLHFLLFSPLLSSFTLTQSLIS